MIFERNLDAEFGMPLDHADEASFGASAPALPLGYLRHCPVHAATPLVELPTLAGSLNIRRLLVKNESSRLGLGSFKALGGAYAVIRLIHREAEARLGRTMSPAELMSAEVRAIAGTLTLCCATDGNHGRSVAAGARLFGANAVIVVHAGVAADRIAAISELGALIEQVPGVYDDAVARSRVLSERAGWHLVSDTSWPGYEQTPRDVMQGYTVLADEIAAQSAAIGAQPTHVFLQAGVGGFAAAIAGHLREPVVVLVEPERAACVLAALNVGRTVPIGHGPSTNMAMLECFEASMVALSVLRRRAAGTVVISDEMASAAAELLAAQPEFAGGFVTTPSAAAGLAGLIAAAADPATRAEVGMGPASTVLIINTETVALPMTRAAKNENKEESHHA